ncbi:hypothetical protein ASA1KI_11850 [Opitutales bacterium ASA1]|nr:hypothetical protein ASA1KI_11850 [Opitutales bacterium ASA1]
MKRKDRGDGARASRGDATAAARGSVRTRLPAASERDMARRKSRRVESEGEAGALMVRKVTPAPTTGKAKQGRVFGKRATFP